MDRSADTRQIDMLEAALGYARRGVPVHALRYGTKLPATCHGFKDATTDEAAIRRLWSEPQNIGTPTGVAGRVVLDVDPRHGGDETLHELERAEGPLPTTPRQKTGGGGEHHFFTTSQSISSSAGQLGPGLDVRATGGYVVLPPSLHESGRRYEWDIAPGDVPIALLPGWILRRLKPKPAEGRREAATVWQQIGQGVGEGQRNVATAKLYGYLLARGVDPILGLELVASWDSKRNNPPLGRTEVEKVCESIAGRERARRRTGR